MATKRPLKVFRTSAGFEDAYIAAPSQKAALAAWGAKRNLFAQGAAELVTSPDMVRAALERPGEVLRVPRGTPADHVAAAGNARGAERRKGANRQGAEPKREGKSRPRPSRRRLDLARDQLDGRQRENAAQEVELAQQIEVLRGKLAAMKKRHGDELAKLQNAVEREERRYRQLLADWQG